MLKPVLAFLAIVVLLQFCIWLQPLLPFYIPPALLGLGLLFFLFLVIKRVPKSFVLLSRHVLQHLSLLFVPAVLSIALYQEQLDGYWHLLAFALFLSTVLSMYITGKLTLYLQQRTLKKSKARDGSYGLE